MGMGATVQQIPVAPKILITRNFTLLLTLRRLVFVAVTWDCQLTASVAWQVGLTHCKLHLQFY